MLYICATPIGNLKDITLRALEILTKCDVILCEDTRVSQKLLNHHNISYNKLIAFHEHNEQSMIPKILQWLDQGLDIVQICDAGTPGISDPGSRLVNQVREYHQVTPIPGSCAYITLLSVGGIEAPSLFYGFLPSTSGKRQKALLEFKSVKYSIGIYESPHRIIDTVSDIVNILGENREIIMGRELTKQFETIKKGNACDILTFIQSDPNQQKGEFVLIILPVTDNDSNVNITPESEKLLSLLIKELPPKKAVNICHEITNIDKDVLYEFAIRNKTVDS